MPLASTKKLLTARLDALTKRADALKVRRRDLQLKARIERMSNELSDIVAIIEALDGAESGTALGTVESLLDSAEQGLTTIEAELERFQRKPDW